MRGFQTYSLAGQRRGHLRRTNGKYGKDFLKRLRPDGTLRPDHDTNT
jgi:hypothetical protein